MNCVGKVKPTRVGTSISDDKTRRAKEDVKAVTKETKGYCDTIQEEATSSAEAG
jgi:hypothetical protein